MQPARVLAVVKSCVEGIIVRDNHSLALVDIFQTQVNQTLNQLRTEFKKVRDRGVPKMIWPRMVNSYYCGENDEPCPVWGPIKDQDGRIMGLMVTPRASPDAEEKVRKPRKLIIDIEWHSPDPD